ncbi:MAG: hypothetical protein NWE83_05160 [Candidatus Bathyarchaeota archaeon]|nr:hypothetical protein [Candidatus Bathyarchaeota archaeon]
MKVPCVLCEKVVETQKEDMYVTVKWCFDEMVEANNLDVDKDLGRVISVCNACWSDKLKSKPDIEDYYWIYDKEV